MNVPGRKANPEEKSAQDFINVEAITDKILWTTDKHLFCYLAVHGSDNALLDEEDHESVTEKLTAALSEQSEPYQIISVPRTVDAHGMIEQLERFRDETDSPARLKLLNGEIAAMQSLVEKGAKEPLIYIKLWKKAKLDADMELKTRANKLAEKLNDNDVMAHIMEDDEILHLCRIYAELGVWQPEKLDPIDIPIIRGSKRLFTSRAEREEANARAQLRNEITPIGGLEIKDLDLRVGSALCRCYGVTRYPAEIDYRWAVDLVGMTESITCITFYPGQDGAIGDALSKSIDRSNREAQEERDTREKKTLERKAASADKVIDDIDARGMAIGHMSIVAMPFAETEKKLEVNINRTMSRFNAKRMRLRPLSGYQREAFRHISPYYTNEPLIDDMLQRIVPLQTVMGGYPLANSIIRDDRGLYFAKTIDGGIMSLDITYRGKDRPNGHGIFAGQSGLGKSTAVKHIVENMFAQGITCIVIDPEREYRELGKNLGASWWDVGGGNAKFNLLQVLPSPEDDEEDPQYKGEAKPLTKHFQMVQTILRYRQPGLTPVQIALLKKALLELYAQWDITLDITNLQIQQKAPQDFPVMADLYHLLRELEKEDPRYEEIATLLEDMAIGSDAHLWNGHTNINLDNPLVIMDTNALYSTTEENQRAIYHNLMRLALAKMTADRISPCAVIGDEAHIMIDPRIPETMIELQNMALRGRKYEGYLWLVFPVLQKLLDERTRIYGQSILDTAAYKILFGADGQTLNDMVELFRLTQEERKFLNQRQRRKALALIGSRHIKVEFELPAYKLELMGAGGGR